MLIELFRNIILRSTNPANAQTNAGTVSLLDPNDKAINDALIKAGIPTNDKSKVLPGAKAYLTNPEFYSDVAKLSIPLRDLMNWFISQKKTPPTTDIIEKVSEIFPGGLNSFISSPDFQRDRVNVTISLIVVTAVPNGTSDLRPQLLDIFKFISALITLSQQPNASFSSLLRRTVLLPNTLFPVTYDNSVAQKKLQDEKDQLKNIENQKKVAIQNIVDLVNQNNSAITELSGAFSQHINLLQKQTQPGIVAKMASAVNSISNSPAPGAPIATAILNSTFLPQEIVSKISSSTKTVLSKYVIDVDLMDVHDAKATIKEQNKILVNQLFTLRNHSTEVTLIGNKPVPVNPVQVTVVSGIFFPPAASSIPTGPCPTAPEQTEEDITTDKWNTRGIIPVLYIGDLQKVCQSLARYELGEIAHIENVLKGESKSNELRRLDKTIQVNVTENETQSDTEKDLQTQDQFSLQTEVSKTIDQNKSFDAGLTVTGKYGPSLTATATANYSQQNSQQQSAQTSSNYARNIISTSVQKIKERVFTSRTTTNIEKVKVVNRHELNNANGADHIRGIYQWVNKIYRLQIMNYGKRAMLEFTIPDPAAFYRYALTTKPDDDTVLVKPDLPGSCINGIFQPLTASDIDEYNYQFLAAKYTATDVKPYPEESKTIIWNNSINVDQSDSNKPNKVAGDSTNPITIQDGYKVSKVNYQVNVMRNDVGATSGTDSSGINRDQIELSIMIGTKEIGHVSLTEWPVIQDQPPVYNAVYQSSFPSNPNDVIVFPNYTGSENSLPISVTGFSTLAIAVNIGLNITCILDPQAYTQWQIDTFNSIIAGYDNLKSQYDRDLKAKQFDNIASIQGRNPLLNREIEKMELKKSVLSQVTGQNYEYFNSMKYDFPPLGYPQMDINDAADEGNYIRFFEQAFEWENMTYLFYPYFWSNKKNWPMLLQLEDNDPLFERFLQAGSARVQVPIRTGFETPVSNYIQNGGTPWLHSDAPQNDDSSATPFLSMINEIKAQDGFDFNEPNPGTISVTINSNIVSGLNTKFKSDDASDDPFIPADYNIDREIIILGKSYRIQSIESAKSITLREAYDGDSQNNIGYYLGAKFVGEFWEELVPTELVYLSKNDSLI